MEQANNYRRTRYYDISEYLRICFSLGDAPLTARI